ncbi:hypothetical protein [Algoriphagus antarcticus]
MVKERTGSSIEDLDKFPKKHFLYIDDILATGGTLYKDFVKWLSKSGENGRNLDSSSRWIDYFSFELFLCPSARSRKF